MNAPEFVTLVAKFTIDEKTGAGIASAIHLARRISVRWTEHPADCIDGWVPGERGVECCDNCARFADDDEAARHVANVLHTLHTNYNDGSDHDGQVLPHIERALREGEYAGE